MLAVILFLAPLFGAHAEPSDAKNNIARNVYRCESASGIVYSDRPCGDAARQITVDTQTMNTYHSASVVESTARSAAVGKSAHNRSERAPTDEKAKHDAACHRIAAALVGIREHFRRGYTVTQGERLKERERALQAQARTKHCH